MCQLKNFSFHVNVYLVHASYAPCSSIFYQSYPACARTKRKKHELICIFVCIPYEKNQMFLSSNSLFIYFSFVSFHIQLTQLANKQRGDEKNRLIFLQGISNTHFKSNCYFFLVLYERYKY